MAVTSVPGEGRGRRLFTAAVLCQYGFFVACYVAAGMAVGSAGAFLVFALPFGVIFYALWRSACGRTRSRVICWLALLAGFFSMPMFARELEHYVRNIHGMRCGNSITDPMAISVFWVIMQYMAQQLYLLLCFCARWCFARHRAGKAGSGLP